MDKELKAIIKDAGLDPQLVKEINRCFSKQDAFDIILLVAMGASVDSAIQDVIMGGEYDD